MKYVFHEAKIKVCLWKMYIFFNDIVQMYTFLELINQLKRSTSLLDSKTNKKATVFLLENMHFCVYYRQLFACDTVIVASNLLYYEQMKSYKSAFI